MDRADHCRIRARACAVLAVEAAAEAERLAWFGRAEHWLRRAAGFRPTARLPRSLPFVVSPPLAGEAGPTPLVAGDRAKPQQC